MNKTEQIYKEILKEKLVNSRDLKWIKNTLGYKKDDVKINLLLEWLDYFNHSFFNFLKKFKSIASLISLINSSIK